MILMTAVRQFVRNYADDTISAVIVKVVTVLIFATGIVVESSVLEMLGASAMGSVMMGYAFAAMSGPQEQLALRRRWAINLCMGVPCGLFAAYKYKYVFPTVPGWVISGLFSGLAGQASVGLIIIAKPYITPILNAYAAKRAKWAMRILGLEEKPDAPNTPTVIRDKANPGGGYSGQPTFTQNNNDLRQPGNGGASVERKDSGSRGV